MTMMTIARAARRPAATTMTMTIAAAAAPPTMTISSRQLAVGSRQ
jgi:hypothetical protein